MTIPPHPKRVHALQFGMCLVYLLSCSLFVSAYILSAVFFMPNSAINPLNPSRLRQFAAHPDHHADPSYCPPGRTHPHENVTATPTLLPTFTLEPSPTLFSLITPSVTPTPTKTPKAPFSATVTYIDSTIIHPEPGCNWQGVGGTIVDANNADMLRITVRLVGFYNGKSRTS